MDLNGREYAVGKLDAMKQFHVARRLGPAIWMLLVASLGSIRELLPAGGATELKDILGKLDDKAFVGAAASTIGPLVGVLAQMSDADSEYVIKTCLSAVKVRSGDSYAAVQGPDGHMMFQDIDLPIMLQLVFAVLRENLANFTRALPLPA